MRTTLPLMMCLLCIGASGCGQQPSNLTIKPPTSGGAMIRLPNDRGFVAVKTEIDKADHNLRINPRNARNRPVSIVAYFFQNDGTTAMSPAPTDVVFEIGAAQNAQAIALSPDASEPNRFASPPGLYSNSLQGIVRAKIAGEEVRESFSAL
jgi:hypothetical protein